MILIKRKAPGNEAGRQVIALFGLGLIGGAIAQAISGQEVDELHDLPFGWLDHARRIDELALLKSAILSKQTQPADVRRIDVVWAAGRAGFGASAQELEAEMQPFEDVIVLCEDLAELAPKSRHQFHLLSSAGGLFEGQRFVDASTKPAPRRPYGLAKLAQEERAAKLRPEVTTSIYRMSSVYGFSGVRGRAGLVNVLIQNARKHCTSEIFGDSDTVRDYVLATDIGNFVTSRMNLPIERSQIFLLASGKPSSIHEILQISEKVTGRPLYLHFDMQPSNASHISYLPSALPEEWRPTDLATGIRQVARQLSTSFAAGHAIQ